MICRVFESCEESYETPHRNHCFSLRLRLAAAVTASKPPRCTPCGESNKSCTKDQFGNRCQRNLQKGKANDTVKMEHSKKMRNSNAPSATVLRVGDAQRCTIMSGSTTKLCRKKLMRTDADILYVLLLRWCTRKRGMQSTQNTKLTHHHPNVPQHTTTHTKIIQKKNHAQDLEQQILMWDKQTCRIYNA